MNKKTKKQLIIGGLVTGAVLLLVNNQSKASAVNTTPTTPSVPSTPAVTYPAGFPIVYGKYNANAKRLQAAMTGIDVDGIVGIQTLTRWQQFNPSITKDFVIANEAQLQSAINYINSKYVPLPAFPSYDIKIFSEGTNNGSSINTNGSYGSVKPKTESLPYYGTDNGPIQYTRADYGEVISGVKKSLL